MDSRQRSHPHWWAGTLGRSHFRCEHTQGARRWLRSPPARTVQQQRPWRGMLKHTVCGLTPALGTAQEPGAGMGRRNPRTTTPAVSVEGPWVSGRGGHAPTPWLVLVSLAPLPSERVGWGVQSTPPTSCPGQKDGGLHSAIDSPACVRANRVEARSCRTSWLPPAHRKRRPCPMPQL